MAAIVVPIAQAVAKFAVSYLGVSTATALTIATFTAKGLLYIGGTLLLTKASRLLGPKAPKVRDFPQDVEYADTLGSRRIIYGENKVSGMNVIPPLVTGSEGEYLHQVLALAGHEVNAIGNVFFNKELLGIDGSGNVTVGTYAGKASVRKYLGTSTQTVDGILNSALTEWTTDHRGRGIAYLALRYQYDTEVYRSGKPDVTCIVQGKKVYDPRLDTSPGANPTDVTYAAYSTNPALCLADYLVASYGLSEAASRVDWALVVSAANICDEDVSIPGSTTQKRFTCNLVLDAISAYETNIEALALAMMGTCYYSGGKWRMYAGAWSSSAFTITADTVIGELAIQTAASRKSDGYYNAVRGRFIDKDRDYQPLEFEPILNSTYESEDGERIYTEVDFPACNNQYEAQRNAIILSKQSRRQKTVTVVCDFSAYKIRPWETGVATIAEVGWSSQPVRCVGWRFRPEPAVELTLQEVSSTDYDDPDPADYVTPASVSVTNPAAYRPGSPQSFTATQEIESILLQWQAPTNTIPGILYQVFEYTSATPFADATKIYEGADTQLRVPRTDTNTRYFWVRSYYRPSNGFSNETPSGNGLSSSGRAATISGYLTNEAIALEADNAGTVTDYSGAFGFFKVLSGTTDVTSSATFAEVSETNVSGEINTADDTPVNGQPKGYYRVTALSGGDTGTYTVSATYGGATITKDFTVTKVQDGQDGQTVNIYLTQTGIAVPADNDGANPVFTNATTTVTVYEGQTDVSASWSVTASPSTGITGTLSTRTYTLTGMTVDTGYVEFTATRSGYDPLTIRLSVTKVRAGATGPTGPAGDVGGISPILDPEFAAVMAYSDGTVVSFDPAQGQFSIFLGEEDLTGSATLSAVATDCTGTVNTDADTPVSGKPKGYYRITAMTADTAKLVISASLATDLGDILMEDGFAILQEDGTFLQQEGFFSVSKTFNVAKSKVGYEIVSELPSSNLFEGRIVFLTTDDKLYRYDGSQWTAAVPTADLTGQIVASQIADAAISTAKFAAGLTPVEIVSSLPAAGNQGRVVFLTTDNKLYRDNGSTWTAAVSTTDLSGTLQDAQIAALAASKITGQLTNSQIADVAAAKLTGQITNTQIGDDSISTAKLQAGSISTAKIAAGAVTADTIASNTITSAQIQAGSITGDRISGNTITASNIASATITGDRIAGNTITASNIAADTITAGQIAAGAISTSELAAGAVTAAKIAAGTITANEIASNTITAGNIAAGAIQASEIATNAVTSDKIFAGAVTAAKISVTNLAAINADMGSITAGNIVLPSGGFIRSGQTAYNTGTGFYLGNDSGTPKFSIGNSSGKNIRWDGSDFTINGGIVTTGSVANNAITEVDYDYASAATSVGTSWADVTSVATVNYPGTGVVVVEGIAQIEVAASFINDPGSVSFYYVEFRLLRDGTEIHSLKMADLSWFESGGFWFANIERSGSIKFYDVPSTGNRDYKLQARVQQSGFVVTPLADISKALVVAEVFKK